MTGITFDIATLWAFIIAFAVFMYIVMDGFDLGLGMLFPMFPRKEDRDVMMNTVAPVWDGNETWLVLGGGGLMAAFPLAYAILMPAIYTPIIAMLIGLIFRGVAFEFRWRTKSERNRWDIAFAGGSLIAALAQGIALGAILQGVHVEGRHYAGGWWDWHPSKAALEYLWRGGRLAVSRRDGFAKIYDLAERVYPACAEAGPEETRDWACRSALERLGFATSGEIAAFWGKIGADEAKFIYESASIYLCG